MTALTIGILGLLLGLALRELFARVRATSPVRGHRPRQPTSTPKGPAPPPPSVGRPMMRGPNYNPMPPGTVKPPPPPMPPNRTFRYTLLGVREVKARGEEADRG